MSYRDESEALRERVRELEGELDAAKETIRRLRGEGDEPPPEDERDPLTGVTKQLHLERELTFEVDDEGLVAIANLLEERIPGGSATQVGNTFTHRKGKYELRVKRGDGHTTLRLEGDYSGARKNLALGAPGLAFLGAVLTAGLFASMRLGRVGIGLGIFLGALTAIVLLRTRIKRSMEADRKHLVATFESVVELCKAHQRPRQRGGRRIEDVDDASAEEEARAAEQERQSRENGRAIG